MQHMLTLTDRTPALSLDAALGCDIGSLFDLKRSTATFERALTSADDAPVTELLSVLALAADSFATSTLRTVTAVLVELASRSQVPLSRRRQIADVLSLVAPVDALDEALRAWLEGADADRRALALRALARPSAHARVPAIACALDDDVDDVAIDAAAALAVVGGREAARSLSTALEKTTNPRRRDALGRALARLSDGGREARVALFSLVDDKDKDLRLAAIHGLLEHHEPGSLTEELVCDPDPRVRVVVATRLSRSPDVGARALLEKLASDADPRVSRAVKGARIGSRDAAMNFMPPAS